jgi:hypothetical protein
MHLFYFIRNMRLLLLLVLIVATTADQNKRDLDSVFNSGNLTESRDQYVYLNYRNSCDDSSIVGIKGVVALEDIDITSIFSQDKMCSVDMACLYDPESELCTSLDPTSIATTTVAVLSNGDIVNCDTSNTATNEEVCPTYKSDACFSSSIYESCKVTWTYQNALADPVLFHNPKEEDQQALSNYYYIIYYSDSSCTSPDGLRAFISDERYSLPVLPEDVSCKDGMACLYNPDGELCQTRKRDMNQIHNFTYTVTNGKDDEMSSCEGTLANNQGGCVTTTPNKCTQSGLFPSCYARYVSASFLARNSKYLVGDVDQNTSGVGKRSLLLASSLIVSFASLTML